MEAKKSSNGVLITVIIIVVGLIVCCCLAVIAFFVLGSTTNTTSITSGNNSSSVDSVYTQLKASADKLNKTLPMAVDGETRLDSAFVTSTDTLKYDYTLINIAKSQIDISKLEEGMKPKLLSVVRDEAEMKWFRDNNITVVYSYKDKNGLFLFEVTITPEQYK